MAHYFDPPASFDYWELNGLCLMPPCAPHEEELNHGTCSPCAAGTENPHQAATCTNCAPGKFKADADATACQNCPADQESVAPFTECRDCDTGKYSVAGEVCWVTGVFEDRNALQTALFGCVGACDNLRFAGTDDSECNNAGAWTSGTGAGCNAGSTHGAIGTWDVSRVTAMNRRKCSNRILSLSHLSDARLPLPSAAVCSLVGSPLSPSSPAVFFPYSCPLLSLFLSHWSPPLLLLVFNYARAFDQDVSSWDVSQVTTMQYSESSVRSLLLLLLVDCDILSSVSPSHSLLSLSFLLRCPPPSLSSSPLTLVSFLLLLVFMFASAFDQDLSSWNVGKVTNMVQSESSVRSALLLVLVDCNVLSSVSLPAALLSLSFLCCSSLIGAPLYVPLTLVSSLLLLVFYKASAFSQTLCGKAWVDNTDLDQWNMFSQVNGGSISDEYCTACSNTDGTALNDGTCTCNTAACTPGTGLYCTFSSSSCHSATLCVNTAGTTENTENCQCGSSVCTAGTGLYCTASSSSCHSATLCANTAGTTENTENCQCGNSVCSDVTGHFCTSSEHKCLRCPVNQEKVDAYCLPTERGDLIDALIDGYGPQVKIKYNTRGQCE